MHVMIPQQIRYNGNQILVECNTGNNYATSSNYCIPKANDSGCNTLLERPISPKMIDLAFGKSLADGKASFIWWVGALKGDLDPSQFDLVDSSDEESYFTVDTMCGWLYGINGTGYLKQCYIPEPIPVPTNAPSCIKPPKPNDYAYWIWVPERCEWVCFT